MADTTANNLTGLSGNFREVYSKHGIENLLPDEVQLQRDIAFAADETVGLEYHQPVITKREHGITYYRPSDTSTNNDGYGLQAAISGQIKDAKIVGSQIMARARIGIEAAARSLRSEAAYKKVFDPIVENLINSVANRAEADLFYGWRPLAKVSSIATNVITVAPAEWAPGIWVGQEGAQLTSFDNDADTAAATAVSLDAVSDAATKTLTVSSGTDFTAGDHIHFHATAASGTDKIGQRHDAAAAAGTGFNSMRGLSSLVTGFIGDAVVTTTILGVAPSSLWGSTVYDAASGPLTLQKINRAVIGMVPKGAPRMMNLYVNPATWADLANDEAAQRRYNNGPKGRVSIGADGIEFIVQTGTVMIKSSPFVKGADAFGIDPKLFKRIGATDLTFKVPGREDEFFIQTPDFASYEIRCYLNYALFTRALGKTLWIKNIVNNS